MVSQRSITELREKRTLRIGIACHARGTSGPAAAELRNIFRSRGIPFRIGATATRWRGMPLFGNERKKEGVLASIGRFDLVFSMYPKGKLRPDAPELARHPRIVHLEGWTREDIGKYAEEIRARVAQREGSDFAFREDIVNAYKIAVWLGRKGLLPARGGSGFY